MDIIQALIWVRVVLYLFTSASLLLLGASVLRPINTYRRNYKFKSLIFFGLSVFFVLIMIAAIFRAEDNGSAALFIVDYLVTPTMIFISSACWYFIFASSKIPSEYTPKRYDEKDAYPITT